MRCIDALEIAFHGAPVSQVDDDRESGVRKVLERERKHGNGHGKCDRRLCTLTELDCKGADQNSANGLVRRTISANGNRAYEQQLEAGAHSETDLQVSQNKAHKRGQHNGAERVKRTELVVKTVKSRD